MARCRRNGAASTTLSRSSACCAQRDGVVTAASCSSRHGIPGSAASASSSHLARAQGRRVVRALTRTRTWSPRRGARHARDSAQPDKVPTAIPAPAPRRSARRATAGGDSDAGDRARPDAASEALEPTSEPRACPPSSSPRFLNRRVSPRGAFRAAVERTRSDGWSLSHGLPMETPDRVHESAEANEEKPDIRGLSRRAEGAAFTTSSIRAQAWLT